LTSLSGTLYMLFPYLPLLLINRKLFHRLSDFSLNMWFSLSVYLLERVCGIRIFIHNSKINKFDFSTKSSIVVMNHRTRLDWLFYFCVLYRMNALSNIKIILKDGLKKIAGPSWAMQTALFIFLKRKWDADKVILKRFLDYYKQIHKNVIILIFPEGTNLTAETKKRSDTFATNNNLEKFDYVLHPRTTGFNYIVKTMRENDTLDCIQDVTVAYHGGKVPESEFEFLKGNLPKEIHFYIDKFELNSVLKEEANNDAETIPYNHNSHSYQNNNHNHNHHHHNGHANGVDGNEKDGKILEKWLFKRWHEKEIFLKNFYASNRPDGASERFESRYETLERVDQLPFLVFYPVYWSLSSLLMIYLCYHYLFFKLFFVVSFGFYAINQYYGSGLDDLILGTSKYKKVA